MNNNISVVYYTDGEAPWWIRHVCLEELCRGTRSTEVIVVKSSEDVKMPTVISEVDQVIALTDQTEGRTHRRLYNQIKAGIEASSGGLVALAEHDVLYPKTYWENLARYAMSGVVTYNANWYWASKVGLFFPPYIFPMLSQCIGPRDLMLSLVESKIKELDDTGEIKVTELTSGEQKDSLFIRLSDPAIDIRHGENFTGPREPKSPCDAVTKVPYWDHHYIKVLVERLKNNGMAVADQT